VSLDSAGDIGTLRDRYPHPGQGAEPLWGLTVFNACCKLINLSIVTLKISQTTLF